jgi:hypothetical protein
MLSAANLAVNDAGDHADVLSGPRAAYLRSTMTRGARLGASEIPHSRLSTDRIAFVIRSDSTGPESTR